MDDKETSARQTKGQQQRRSTRFLFHLHGDALNAYQSYLHDAADR